MSRPVRFIPIMLLLALISAFAMKLIRPADPAITSQLVSRELPSFALDPATPAKPGLATADFADGKPRLLNIFASWCVPCTREAAVLQELKKRGATIEAIAVRDTPKAVSTFLSRNGDPFDRVGADPQSDTQIALGSSGVPETFVIDGHGVIRRQYIGPLTNANIHGVLRELREVQ
jgi:cytochrome c biogenesis protein CcmG/thiol:disulfide interchange protein DsbE